MEKFEIIQPCAILAPYIKHYWFLKTNSATATQVRTVPTGHICIMFHRGERIFSASDNDLQPQSFISGQENKFFDLVYTGTVDMICVVFRPVGAKVFFNIPINAFNGIKINVRDLGDRQLSELENRVFDANHNQECALYIEQFLLKRLQQLTEYNLKRINTAIELINAGHTNVNALADSACLSYKQFKRIFSEYTGANPKEFLRVIRFQRALFLLQNQPEISLAQLAFESGYYDQPHLVKEFKSLSGYTPTEYIAACSPYSDYFS